MSSEEYLGMAGSSSVTTDLDAFLTGVYRYYLEKGLRPLLLRSASNLVASVFTFALSVVVLLLIDWGSVISCTAEDVCRSLRFFYDSPILPLTWYRFMVLCQLVPLGLYTVVLASLSSVAKMREAIRISAFYKESLGIRDDAELWFVPYEEIVRRICQHQRTAETPLCIVQDTLSPLEVQNIVMRTENFSIAVWKQWYRRMEESGDRSDAIWRLIERVPLQSTAVQWCLQFGVIGWLFDDRYRLRPEIVLDLHRHVRTRIQQVGFVTLGLMFPLAIFSAILLLVKESDDVRTQRSSLFANQWSSEVIMRHFCEPTHASRIRLEQARAHAEKFSCSLIADGGRQALARSVKYMAGGLVAVLGIVAVVQEGALLYMTVFGKSLFFYFAVFSGLVGLLSGLSGGGAADSLSKARLVTKGKSSLALLATVHMLPTVDPVSDISDLRMGRSLDEISKQFSSFFFVPKLISLLTEMLGIVLLPFLFLVVFPDKLTDIICETRIFSSHALGDFPSAGFMSGGVAAGQQTEMLSTTTSVHRFAHLKDREKIVSLLSFANRFGADSGLNKEQLNIVRSLNEFMRECESMLDPALLGLGSEIENRTEFWYLALHAVLFGGTETSAVSLNRNLVEMVREVVRVTGGGEVGGA